MERNIYPILLAIVLGAVMFGVGRLTVGRPESTEIPLPVAIIDLDDVASRTGHDDRMNSVIRARETVLNEQLEVERAAAESQFAKKKSETGEEPTDEQMAELQSLQQEVARKLLMAQQTAQNQLAQLRAQLIAEFRSDVQPVVRRIAAAGKISLVLTKNDAMVLTFDPLIDITDDVVGRLRRTPAPQDSTPTNQPSEDGDALPDTTRTE